MCLDFCEAMFPIAGTSFFVYDGDDLNFGFFDAVDYSIGKCSENESPCSQHVCVWKLPNKRKCMVYS